MNQAIIAAYMACSAYSQYGTGNETGVTYVYEGVHAAECEQIQAEYKQEIELAAPALNRARDAAADAAIKAAMSELKPKR